MKLKRILAAFAAAAMLCGVTGCSSGEAPADTSNRRLVSLTKDGRPESPGVLRGSPELSDDDTHSPTNTSKTYRVGIAKLTDHPALNQSEAGFVAALEDAGFVIGENLLIDYRDGQGETSNLDAIAEEFVGNSKDLIFAIATPAAQACANKTTTIPIIGTAITDFVDAGLIESNSRPGTNVSGTTDMSPVEEQIDLMVDIFRETETIGFVYTASESNSALQIGIARDYAESLGLSTVTMTIDSEADIERVFSEIASQCDAVYLPTDNLLAGNMPAVAAVCNPAQIPVFCAEGGMVENGGFGTLAIDYYDLGYQAGLMAVKVLDGTSIDGMSIKKSTKFEYSFNGTTLEALGVTLPVEYREYVK